METLVIDKQDIRSLVEKVGLDPLMRDMIAGLKDCFAGAHAGEIEAPARAGFSYQKPQLGLVEWMPVMRAGGPVCVKMVGYHPTNPVSLNLPTILSTISLYDTRNGHLIGLADATFLTALRTGAASAVASKWLAKTDSRVLGVIGCGAQAVSQIHALTLEFPSLSEIVFSDVDTATEGTLENRLASLKLSHPCRALPLEEVVAKADILCTATSVEVGSGPVFEGQGCQPWLHINAVGSDFPGKTEVPLSLLRRAFVCPDFIAQAITEGECQQLAQDEIGADLATISHNPTAYAEHREKLTVFDSTGWAVEDLAAMEILLGYARELGLGHHVDLECISNDPMNPYDFSASTYPLEAVVSSEQSA